MLAVELVVAVGGEHERGHARDPARKEPHDVEHGPERAGSEERLTCAPQKPRTVASLFFEPPQERRLSHSGLTGYQHEPAARAAGDRTDPIAERRKLERPLEKLAAFV